MVIKKQTKNPINSVYNALQLKVKQLENCCIHEVDKHLNDYLFELVLDMGSDTLDIEIDTYYYWNEQESGATDMLSLVEKEYYETNEDKSISDLMLRLIQLKRIAHSKMKESSYYEEVIAEEKKETERIEQNKEFELIKLNPSIKVEDAVKIIYNNLYPKFIQVDFNQFERHFIRSKVEQKKIIWMGTEIQVVHLFNFISSKSIISEKNLYALISYHFINKRGRILKPKQLSVVNVKSTTNKEYEDRIKLMVQSIQNIAK